MPGNSIGETFRVTTFGESHGDGVGVVIDGCPPRIPLCPEDFVRDMVRRRPGKGLHDTPRREVDAVAIRSGVFEDATTGAPIALYIRNRDVDSRPYEVLRQTFRPGHADYTYFRKYGHHDFRGGGRSSARETAARVAAGVVARKILEPADISVTAYTLEIGGIRVKDVLPGVIDTNSLFCPDPRALEPMEAALRAAKNQKDSLGGIVEARISGCPAGLGEPVFGKLDADLARAAMSIGSVKGVEIGEGFGAARLKGSENNDPMTPGGFKTNRAGGILGGISNGDDILIRIAVKPVPSIGLEQESIDRSGRPFRLTMTGRFDVSAVPRVVPVLEAMVRIVLADHYLRNRVMSPWISEAGR
jgi:chorismate synthase